MKIKKISEKEKNNIREEDVNVYFRKGFRKMKNKKRNSFESLYENVEDEDEEDEEEEEEYSDNDNEDKEGKINFSI